MPSPLDRFMPCTRFALPDGSLLTVSTITRDDQVGKDVYISHIEPSSPEPVFQLVLPPHSVDAIIHALQERANEARFVNGEPMLEYPEPVPVKTKPKRQTKAKARQ